MTAKYTNLHLKNRKFVPHFVHNYLMILIFISSIHLHVFEQNNTNILEKLYEPYGTNFIKYFLKWLSNNIYVLNESIVKFEKKKKRICILQHTAFYSAYSFRKKYFSFIEGLIFFLHKINEVISNEGAGLHFAKCSKLQENCKFFNIKTL